MTGVVSRHRLVAVLLGMSVVVLSACGSSETAEVSAPLGQAEGVRVVSVEQAASLLELAPAPTIVDVRTPQEFAQGHLEGAVLVDFNAPDFRDRIAEFPRDGHYVIYCRSGNRSAGARQVMTDLGFTDVADIEGGVVAWAEQGRPLTS